MTPPTCIPHHTHQVRPLCRESSPNPPRGYLVAGLLCPICSLVGRLPMLRLHFIGGLGTRKEAPPAQAIKLNISFPGGGLWVSVSLLAGGRSWGNSWGNWITDQIHPFSELMFSMGASNTPPPHRESHSKSDTGAAETPVLCYGPSVILWPPQ